MAWSKSTIIGLLPAFVFGAAIDGANSNGADTAKSSERDFFPGRDFSVAESSESEELVESSISLFAFVDGAVFFFSDPDESEDEEDD